MALIYFDGFEAIGNDANPVDTLLSRRYSVVLPQNVLLTTGKFGGVAAKIDDDDDCWFNFGVNLSTDTTKYWAYSFYVTSEYTDAGYMVRWVTDTGQWSIGLRIKADGTLVFHNNANTVIAVSKLSCCPAGQWHEMEIKLYCHASAGTIDIVVNGVTVMSETGLNTINTTTNGNYHNYMRIFGQSAFTGAEFIFDDVYVMDTAGSLNNAGAAVSLSVSAQFADGDDTTDWTPNTGNDHYVLVDEWAPDDDTTYISSATISNQDIFTYEDGPTDAVTIYGAKLTTDGKEGGGGGGVDLYTIITSGGSDYLDSGETLTASYDTYERYAESDPNTSTYWTLSGYNAAKFGVEVK